MTNRIKNIDYFKFFKARKIADDINKLSKADFDQKDLNLHTTLSEEDWIKIEELVDRFPSEFMINRAKSLNPTRDAQRLIKSIELLKSRKRIRTYKFAASFAAAMIAVSFVLWNISDSSNQNIISYNNVDQSITTPVLVLESGEKVELNKESGVIVLGASKMEKVGANAISYGETNDSVIVNHKIIVPAKYSFKVTLSDGSEVMLNAGSTLKYPSKFSGTSRKVELSGEGYFIIKKSEMPFVVAVDNAEINVYGTEFNVKNTSPDRIETVLVKGSIGMRVKDIKEVKMMPNQRYVYNKKMAIGELEDVDVDSYLQWQSNNFKYVQKDLEAVLRDISIWYGVKFIGIDKLAGCSITLFAGRDCKIEDILKFIEKLTDIRFIKEGGESYHITKI